jgi:hypothetical protein
MTASIVDKRYRFDATIVQTRPVYKWMNMATMRNRRPVVWSAWEPTVAVP